MFSVKNLIYSFCPKKQMREGLGCGGCLREEGQQITGPAEAESREELQRREEGKPKWRGVKDTWKSTVLKPDPLRFWSLLLFCQLDTSHGGDFIGRRPPPDWHVVKYMGAFSWLITDVQALVLGCWRKQTEWAWEAGLEAAHPWPQFLSPGFYFVSLLTFLNDGTQVTFGGVFL